MSDSHAIALGGSANCDFDVFGFEHVSLLTLVPKDIEVFWVCAIRLGGLKEWRFIIADRNLGT